MKWKRAFQSLWRSTGLVEQWEVVTRGDPSDQSRESSLEGLGLEREEMSSPGHSSGQGSVKGLH